MSDRLNITAEPRVIVGKKVKRLRRKGIIPAVVYGRTEALNIQLENLELRRILRQAGTTSLVNVIVGKDERTVLVRDIQSHVTRGDLIHVDFQEVDLTAMITAEAELVAVGQPGAETEGLGVVTLTIRTVGIESLPDDLVSEIEVDISLIETPGDVVSIRDLAVPKGVTILAEPDLTVARFTVITEEEEEEEEEDLLMPAADSVEVVGKEGEEEEESEE